MTLNRQDNDEELLYMIHQHDEWALVTLLGKYQPLVRGLIRSNQELCGPIAALMSKEDLIQEGAVMILEAAHSFREDQQCSFKTYLTHCLRKHLITLFRKTQSMKELAHYKSESLDMLVSEEHTVYRTESIETRDRFMNPVYCFRLNESMLVLKQVLQQLNDQERNLFSLYMNRVPYRQAAALMNCTTKSYDNRLTRLKRKIARLLVEVEE